LREKIHGRREEVLGADVTFWSTLGKRALDQGEHQRVSVSFNGPTGIMSEVGISFYS